MAPTRILAPLVLGVALLGLLPGGAAADGPVAPIAVNYSAAVGRVPAGVTARVIDGYLTIWMQVATDRRVTVLDYRGVPWVRFDRGGVAVNRNSEEYYLSQVPVPAVPPASLTSRTPPHWIRVSSGHSYRWRDGRLHAFAAIALAPGTRLVGHWAIPMLLNGRPATVSGAIYYHPRPSIVWFWPIIVFVACVLAAWRVRDASLDRRLARGLTGVLLAAIAIAGLARYLHGRPGVTAGELLVLALILAGVTAGSLRLAGGRSGYLLLFLVAFASLWAGLTLSPSLVHGDVLLALPALVVRTAAVVLLGGGVSLILLALRALDSGTARARADRRAARVTA